MRLFLIDHGTEITGINFTTVRKVLNTGGTLSCYITDTTLANIGTNFSCSLERVEVRKNDGSTVLWEGVIKTCTQYSQPTWEFHLTGEEMMAILDRIPCNYNSTLASGVVTDLAGDFIIDDNASFGTALLNKPCYFSNDSDGETSELIFPHANSTWYNYADGPPNADDPANVETKTPNGDETDLANAGVSSYWEIHDTDNRAKDWYGICIDFEVPNYATSQRVAIYLDCLFEVKVTYAAAADAPIVQIYDVTNGSWESDDTLNAGNLIGIGRTSFYSEKWDMYTSRYKQTIAINYNCDRYFDGSGFLKIRVLCGKAIEEDTSHDRVRIYQAILTNIYAGSFKTAGETTYIIDARTATTLTFTGQTPDSDGVDVGSSYTIGDYLHVNMRNIWNYAMINLVDLDFDTATIGEANEYRGMYVGPVLDDFAERLNWEVWQAVGWVIKCYGSFTSTALSLTEDNFCEWSLTGSSEYLKSTIILWGSGVYSNIYYTTGTYYTPEGKFYIDTRWAEEAMGGVAAPAIEDRYSASKLLFNATIDLEDGTDYSALDVGKTIDVIIQTDKVVINDGLIIELSYDQNAGEHLMCNMVVQFT